MGVLVIRGHVARELPNNVHSLIEACSPLQPKAVDHVKENMREHNMKASDNFVDRKRHHKSFASPTHPQIVRDFRWLISRLVRCTVLPLAGRYRNRAIGIRRVGLRRVRGSGWGFADWLGGGWGFADWLGGGWGFADWLSGGWGFADWLGAF